jgi:hypothetical protein
VKKTVDFAVSNNLYLHADEEAVEILMRHNPCAQIIWAHPGFGLASERVSTMLAKYPKLWESCLTVAALSMAPGS